MDLDDLVACWLTVPEVADRLGTGVGEVRRLIRDRHLLAARRGERSALSVPQDLVVAGHPVADLQGTATVLADAGFSAEESLRWLLTPDESLPGKPIDALRAGRRAEVRRRAQALAL